MADATIADKIQFPQGGNSMIVASGGILQVDTGATVTGVFARNEAKSVWFNLDNGAGTTIDDVIILSPTAITITSARIVYVDVTSGTVAGGSVIVGTAVAGTQIVASTNYENSKAVGTSTALVIASGAVAANTPVIVRHTGVAATAVGQAFVEITYSVNT